jgi:hypothetical protein
MEANKYNIYNKYVSVAVIIITKLVIIAVLFTVYLSTSFSILETTSQLLSTFQRPFMSLFSCVEVANPLCFCDEEGGGGKAKGVSEVLGVVGN